MAVHPPPDTHNRSLSELFSDLSRQTRELFTEEIALAKAEIREKVSRVTRSGIWFGVAGVMALAGLFLLLATAVLGLVALGLQPWLAALIVAVIVLGIAFVALQSGRSLLKQGSLAPKQTIDSLKENAAWIRSHTS